MQVKVNIYSIFLYKSKVIIFVLENNIFSFWMNNNVYHY